MADTGDAGAGMRRFRPEGGGGSGGSRLRAVRDFGSNPGGLALKAYAPPGLKPGAPLVVVLHGCTQLAGGYEASAGWTALADEHRFAVLYPEQRRVNNPKLCFSWFAPHRAARDKGEAASIRQMIETMTARWRLDRKRVFVTGLSAGGAMAAVMLASYPEVFAGGAIVAGLPFGAADGVSAAFAAMSQGRDLDARSWGDLVRAASPHEGPWPRVTIWQGAEDATVARANADGLFAQWADVHGLDAGRARETQVGPVTRKALGDAVELNIVAGMDHGVPIDAARGERAAPYMLDVGVSQARATLAFWGLDRQTHRQAIRSVPSRARPAEPRQAPPSPSPAPVAATVEAVITKALRAAGLMK
ncbi:alpha/beta hydrolase family esterase [Methylopila henanensis]|uniref:Alpha/beta hydrolase family esterase n=1 Tax=Methylopila henanensis TaxID=873516 RepID=A0ABW4K7Z9_9HYPH